MTVLRHVPLFTSAATSGNGLITLWPAAAGQSTALRVCISGRPETQLVTSWLRVGLVIPCFSWLYLDNHETISYIWITTKSRMSASGSATRNTIIDGQSATVGSLHQALANAVEAHLHARHRAPCAPKTKLLFARMDFRGVGNDLNSAIRAFACALAQDRQVVFLPPSSESMDKYPWLKELGVSWQSPWHW